MEERFWFVFVQVVELDLESGAKSCGPCLRWLGVRARGYGVRGR